MDPLLFVSCLQNNVSQKCPAHSRHAINTGERKGGARPLCFQSLSLKTSPSGLKKIFFSFKQRKPIFNVSHETPTHRADKRETVLVKVGAGRGAGSPAHICLIP